MKTKYLLNPELTELKQILNDFTSKAYSKLDMPNEVKVCKECDTINHNGWGGYSDECPTCGHDDYEEKYICANCEDAYKDSKATNSLYFCCPECEMDAQTELMDELDEDLQAALLYFYRSVKNEKFKALRQKKLDEMKKNHQ